MRFFILVLTFLVAGPSFAADIVVRDGDTIQLGAVTYKLDGIDAPEFDQMCIDDHADAWTCGVEARDQLAQLVGNREVRCEDLGPDKAYAKRHVGLCTVAGETVSLNQSMVRLGFALNAEGRFKDDETGAKNDRKGLWKGCFVAPQEFRGRQKTGALLGAACRSDRDSQIRESLFPEETTMPPGCSIKARYALRARVTGKVGVYHLQACRSYAPVTKPDRWFCTEDDAQAAGFRKAYNCRAITRKK